MIGLPREKAQAWLFRPESSGTLADLTADDVVLLTGEATDRFTAVVRDAHLTAGCTLAWVEGPDQLEAALAHVSPTHVLLDHVTAKVLEDLLEVATIDGVAVARVSPRGPRVRLGARGRGPSQRAQPQARGGRAMRWRPGGAAGCGCSSSTPA